MNPEERLADALMKLLPRWAEGEECGVYPDMVEEALDAAGLTLRKGDPERIAKRQQERRKRQKRERRRHARELAKIRAERPAGSYVGVIAEERNRRVENWLVSHNLATRDNGDGEPATPPPRRH